MAPLDHELPASAQVPNGANGQVRTETVRPEHPPYQCRLTAPPAALEPWRHLLVWGAWNHVWNERKKRCIKPPHSATSGRMQKGTLNAPGFLGTFDQALATMRRRGLAGIGISLEHAKLTGADLDDCITDSGLLTPLAAEVLGYAETYAESSQSGTGLHFLANGAAADVIKRDDLGIELYSTGRFFIVTGRHLDESPNEIREAPRLIECLATLDAETPKPGKISAPRKPNGHGKPSADAFWTNVNTAALADLDKWVTVLHPTARKEAGTGAWRVTSLDLGRDLEEDLAYHPDGIADWGEEYGMTAIDAVQRFGVAPDAKAAALWLCQQLHIEAASLGWQGGRTMPPKPSANPRHEEQGSDAGTFSAPPEPEAPPAETPLVRIEPGKLSEMATDAETHLLAARVPFYQRSGMLVRPVTDTVSATGGRKTTTASLKPVCMTYMRDQLCRVAAWERYVRRDKEWIKADPPKEVAETILARSGEWRFPSINGVLTTPTLRPDGSLLSAHGYDEATQLSSVSAAAPAGDAGRAD